MQDETYLEINDCETIDFEKIKEYTNLNTLIIKERRINDITFIDNLIEKINFDKLDNLDCYFKLNKILLRLNLENRKLKLALSYFLNNENFNDYITNGIQILSLSFLEDKNISDKNFKNLPSSLQLLEINFNSNNTQEYIERNQNGIFNFLFNIKLPFGSIVEISIRSIFETKKYKFDSDNVENSLEQIVLLDEKNNRKIYVKYNMYALYYYFCNNL